MTASPDIVSAALAQVNEGFAVFALARNAKIPVTEHGFKNATTNPDWVRTQLAAPTAGNYGMVWPTDAQGTVVAFDLDDGGGASERWEDRLMALMNRLGWLPATKATTTPSGGRHAFYRWPADVPIPPGDELFGFTVRWPGRGYLVGPGSVIDGRFYQAGAVTEIAELPPSWVDAAIAEHPRHRPSSDAFITVTGGFVLPERIGSGRRYSTVRDYVASRYNSGLGEAELWALVKSEVAPRFVEQKPEVDLRKDFDRVMAKITERLGPPSKVMREQDAVAAVSPLGYTRLSEIATEAVPWLWHRYLPVGSITLFDGNPGEGKSTVVADLIARLTRGTAWPDETPIDGPSTVLYVTKEDDPATQVRPRIEAAGGDASRVLFVAADLLFPRDQGRFRELLAETKPQLVLLDPLMSYLEGRVKAISDNEVRSAIMTPLGELARETGCVMLVIRHFNKAPGQSALNRGAGSLGGLAGAARMVLALAPDPEADDDRTRVFGVIKSNYEARPPSLRVTIDSAPVEGFQMTVSRASWQGTSDTSVGDLMERTREEHQQLLDAEEALWAVLKDAREPMASKAVQDAMKTRGHPRNVVYRAAKALRIHVERVGYPSRTVWSLPVVTVVTGDGDSRPSRDSAGTTEDASRPSRDSAGTTDSLTRVRARRKPATTSTTERERDDWEEETVVPVVPDVGLPAGAPAREAQHVAFCRDYEAHRNFHHRTADGWACAACADGASA